MTTMTKATKTIDRFKEHAAIAGEAIKELLIIQGDVTVIATKAIKELLIIAEEEPNGQAEQFEATTNSSRWTQAVDDKLDALTQKTQAIATGLSDVTVLLEDVGNREDKRRRAHNIVVRRIDAIEAEVGIGPDETGQTPTTIPPKRHPRPAAVDEQINVGNPSNDDAAPGAGLEPDALDDTTATGIPTDAPDGIPVDGIDQPESRYTVIEADLKRRRKHLSNRILTSFLAVDGSISQTGAALSLVLKKVPSLDMIESWTASDRGDATRWAAAQHLANNDRENAPDPPAKPDWLLDVVEIITTPADLEDYA